MGAFAVSIVYATLAFMHVLWRGSPSRGPLFLTLAFLAVVRLAWIFKRVTTASAKRREEMS